MDQETTGENQPPSVEIAKHHCEEKDWERADTGPGFWGLAITSVSEFEDGSMWADNEEYGSRVNYCPFCGQPAKLQMKRKIQHLEQVLIQDSQEVAP